MVEVIAIDKGIDYIVSHFLIIKYILYQILCLSIVSPSEERLFILNIRKKLEMTDKTKLYWTRAYVGNIGKNRTDEMAQIFEQQVKRLIWNTI